MARESGFHQLQTWIPQSVVDQINPHAAVTADKARELVSTALATTLIVVAVLIAVAVLAKMRDGLLGRSLFRKTNRFLAFVRKASTIALLAAPWWAVWKVSEGEVPGGGLVALTFLAALAWLCATAADHSAMWLDRRKATIELRDGFAIFKVKRVSIRLDGALRDARSGQPLTGQLSEASQRRNNLSVSLAPEAWQLVSKQLDRVSALAFLAAALASFGLRVSAPALPAGDA